MGLLPRISGQEAVRTFQKFGYEVVRQRGSHIRLRHATEQKPALTVPNHRELKTGLLRGLIRDAGISVDQFLGAL